MMQGRPPGFPSGMHGGPNGFPPGMQGGPGGMTDMGPVDEDLLKEAREWLGDKVDEMGPKGMQGGGNPLDQLPQPKTRRISIDTTKRSTLDSDDAIAIVGVGGKFPGADTIDEFWRVLENGENHVIEIPPERWNVEEYYSDDWDEPGKTYVRRAGFLKNFDEFDCKMFGISEPEAAKMDPQQRYILECVHMALEDGGIMRKDINGSRTGVYIGVMNDDYKSSATEDPAVASNYTLTGTAPSIVAARVSYVYNLLGPSMSIDTACSSSLVAIHLASQALKCGDCSMAICGGVNSILYPDILIPLAKARMVSPSGQCQAFADTADGYIRGEGGGVVVLKRLKEALEDGNKIWATIATACNQDGRTMTPITAPSVQMQTELLQEVYEFNNVNPAVVQYIEAHGTGTPVGDPIEANSLGEFFSQYRSEDSAPLKIGSVKTNVGHLESAAGVAGLVKVLLMMKHGKTVKSLHFERPNPKIDFPKYNMAVTIDVTEWPALDDGTRVSCVNSFGFGGTNSHAIIKQFIVKEVQETDNTDRKFIIFLSALDNGGLSNSLSHFAQCLIDSTDTIRSIAYTSACKREHFKYRIALAAESKEELRQKAEAKLKTVSEVKPPGLNPPNIVFVFCGVGTTWNGMCKELLHREPVFCETVKRVDDLLKRHTDWSIFEKLEEKADVSDPLIGHLAIFTCQVGLLELWKHYGIEPKAVLGQSVGEVAAAYAAGALSLEDAVTVIYHRSSILAKATGGSMFVVGNSNTQMVEELCQEYGDRINIAVYNSSKSCTVSGDSDVGKEVMEKLKKKSEEENDQIFMRDLNVRCAYHSHHTEGASVDLENALNGLSGSTPTLKLISTVTGEEAIPEQFVTSSYWKDNVRKPVLFQKAVRKASVANTLNIYLEIGPKPVLKAHLSDSFAPGKAVSLTSMNESSEISCFYDSLADLYQYGVTPTMEKVNPYSSRISDIPKYIPNRMKSLFEADSTILRRQGRNKLSTSHPFVKRQSDDNTPFKIDISTSSTPYVYEHNVAGNILVPGAFYAEVGLEASKHLLKQSPFSLEVAVDFLRPLRLSPGSPCEAYVMLKSLEPSKNMSFTIQTGHDIIARGTSACIKDDVRLSLVDIRKIRGRCNVFHPKEKTYDTLKSLGFTYGKDLQILGNGYKSRTECIVDVTLSELLMKDLNDTNIHPAVLDGLLQTPGIIQDMMEERPSGQLLPAGFAKLILRRTPEKHMLAYMNLTSFSKDEIIYNLLLLQPDGIVVAEVKDFVIRSIEKSEKTNGQLAHQIRWNEIDLSHNKAACGDPEVNLNDHVYTEPNIKLEKGEQSCEKEPLLSKDDRNTNYDNSEKKDKEKENISPITKEVTEKQGNVDDTKNRSFVFITRDKNTAASFKSVAYDHIEINYYILDESSNVKNTLEHIFFETGQSSKEHEVCLIFATGQMDSIIYDGKSLLEELANDSELLLKILQFMAEKPKPVPMYIITRSTQPIDLEGSVNLIGSQLWGLVRSVLREQSFKLYLVDVDPTFKSCIDPVFDILSGNIKKLVLPEIAIRNGRLYDNEFVAQPDEERNKSPKLNSVDEYSVVEYRSRFPDSLKDTFYSLQQADGDVQDGWVNVKLSQACLHDAFLYPLTFEKAVDALNLWPHENTDGYGVLTFEIVGTITGKKSKNNRSAHKYVACYPLKIQSIVNVPKSCVAPISDLPSYVPGMLRTTSLLWELVDKLPPKKNYCIITDNDHESAATILKELISTRRSGPVLLFKMEEMFSLDQMAQVIIPLTKFDLQTAHGILETSNCIQMIASLRYFLTLPVERYISARSPQVQVVALDVDNVLAKTRLPQIVPSVIKWLKKQKYNLQTKDFTKSETSEATFGLPSRIVDIDISSDINQSEVRIPDALIFRKTAVYIVIGGMTGLGWEITKYLAEKGAGFVVSLSRREPPNEKQEEIKDLSNRYGCCITTAQTDITDMSSLQQTFDKILQDIPYPVRGIFQGAGILDDALFVSMTKEKLMKVLTPKVLGTWNLHMVSRNLCLDYFVMHSSMTSVFGNAGQTNYGAANAFLDCFAHYRRSIGLAGQSINWGPLKVGMASSNDNLEDILKRRGMFALSVSTIKKCFLEVLKNNSPQVTYGAFDWDIIASGLESDEMYLVQYRFRGFIDKILEQKRAKKNQVQLNFDLNEIMSIPKEERMEAIIKALQILASEVFGVELSLLNEDTLISSLGIDSMLAMTFAQTVLKVMHVKISLVMLLTDGTTIMSLAEAINNILENGGGEAEPKRKEIDASVYDSMTPYEKRAYNGHVRNKYDPSLYMFGDVYVNSVIAKPEYWEPLILKIHKKYRALRTLFVPGHDNVRYGVKRVIVDPEEVQIDFRIVRKSLLCHKTRHPPNVDDYLFDPAKDLPMRVFYAKKGKGAIIRFLFNHLALDLSSISRMMNDLTPKAKEEDLGEPGDIAVHIERRLVDDETVLKEYWKSVIPKNLVPMSLTTSGSMETDPNYFEFIRINVPSNLVDELKKILQASKVTLFQFFTTMFEILLYVELNQSTIAIMTTVDCRMFFTDLKKEANRFTNRIPLFLELNDSKLQVVEILLQNRKHIMDSIEHGYLPFMDIIEDVESNSINEIFRHQIVMEETAKISSLVIDHGKRMPLRVRKLQVGNYYNETILYVWNDETTKKLDLELGCSSLIISQDRANNLLNFMVMMIERLVSNPTITLEEMTSYNVSTPPKNEISNTNEDMQNRFMKQTTKGWDHEVFLNLGSEEEKCLKWGSRPNKMTRSVPYMDILDIQIVDIHDQKALILTTKSRKIVLKTNSKNQATQWWLSIREKKEDRKKMEITSL